MPMYKVTVLPIARDDIADIYLYIAIDNPEAAFRVTNEIVDKIDTLTKFPERCPIVQDNILARQGYRMLIIESYIAFFKVFESEVMVYRVG